MRAVGVFFSRARAYAMTGDYLAQEPFCSYQPGSYQKNIKSLKDTE